MSNMLLLHCKPVLRIWTWDPGSGIQCLFDPWTRIPIPYFLELSDIFLGKKFHNSLKTGPNFFLLHFKKKIILNFVKFLATKKGMTTNSPPPPLSFAEIFGSGIREPGSGIRDPGWEKHQDPGPGINIPDQQQCCKQCRTNLSLTVNAVV
jgi:hypothetical protein